MKKILVVLSLVLSLVPELFAQTKEPVTSIRFEIFNRTVRTKLTITKDSAISIGRKEQKFILINSNQWNALVNSLQSTDLAGISKLVSPTHNRDVDGASHCKIVIYTDKNIYQSQYFDSGKPMPELQKVYDAITVIADDIAKSGQTFTK